MHAMSSITSRVVWWHELTENDISRWTTLLQRVVPLGNAFLSPTFARAAGEAYGRVGVCFLEDGADLVAVLPFQFHSVFASILGAAERVGEEMNDYFGILARDDFRCTPGQLLAFAGLNLFHFSHLGEEQARHGLSGETSRLGLRIELANHGRRYWELLRDRNRKFASDTERRERKAQQTYGALRFSFAEVDLERWFHKLLEEKRRQYRETGRGDWRPRQMQLLNILRNANSPDCMGTISTLQFGDSWAAIHFGLKSRRTLHYWIPVYNPLLSAYAPGRLLLRQIILHADETGLSVIDRGVGDSHAKRDFPSAQRSYGLGVWQRPGPAALTYRALHSAHWRINSLQRSLRGELRNYPVDE
jgi:CelD/BcsL family acetyltransferase involved in cellulose biosynthesis